MRYFVGFDTDLPEKFEEFVDVDAAMERVEELSIKNVAHIDAAQAELTEYEFGDRYGIIPVTLDADPEVATVGWPVMVSAESRDDLVSMWNDFLNVSH